MCWNRKLIYLLITLFFGIINVWTSRYPNNFIQYSIQEGLSHSLPKCIIQTSDGHIWIGTHDGLNRFNGHEFEVYRPVPFEEKGIRGVQVEHLFESSDKNLWIVTNEGVDLYNPYLEQFFHVDGTFEVKNVQIEELSDNTLIFKNVLGIYGYNKELNRIQKIINTDQTITTINFFKIVGQHVYIGSDKGIFIFHQDELTAAMRNEKEIELKNATVRLYNTFSVLCMMIDISGNYWFGTNESGLCFLKSTEVKKVLTDPFTPVPFKQYIFSEPVSNTMPSVFTIHQDKNLLIWLGTRNGIAQVNTMGNDTSYQYFFNEQDRLDPNHQNAVRRFFEDHAGNLWIATDDREAFYYYDITEKKLHLINSSRANASLPTNRIRHFYEDNTNTVWLLTIKEGICKYHPNYSYFNNLRMQNDQNQINVYAINQQTDSTLLFGTDQGLYMYNSQQGFFDTIRFIPAQTNGMGATTPGAIAVQSSDTVWIGYLDGQLSMFNPETRKFTNLTYTSNERLFFDQWTIYNIITDHQNNLYISTSIDALYFDTKDFSYHSILDRTKFPGLAKGISCMVVENENVWIGSMLNGLFKFDRSDSSIVNYVYDRNRVSGLSANKISCLLYDSHVNCLWIGTFGGGMNRLDLGNNHIEYYIEEDGFPSNVINAIEPENQNRLWLSTNNGLSLYQKDNHNCINFNRHDGLITNEFNPQTSFKTLDGKIIFGGRGGAVIIDPKMKLPSDSVFTATITDLIIHGKKVKPGEKCKGQVVLSTSVIYQDTLIIRHYNNDFALVFNSFYFPNPHDITYVYMLEGYHDEWKTTRYPYNMVSFANLIPGEYRFLIKVKSKNGSLSEVQDQLIIKVLPPWYKTMLFRLLIFGGIVAMVSGFIIMRTYRISQRNKILEDLVADRTNKIQSEKETLQLKLNEIYANAYNQQKEDESTPAFDKLAIDSIGIKMDKIADQDKKFLLRFLKVLNENMSDHEMDVSAFASKLAMSRSTLHNHLKKITGLSATELIRNYKIYAGSVFIKKGYSISETLYFIGINSRSYFNKCFKEKFGVTPSSFLKHTNSEDLEQES